MVPLGRRTREDEYGIALVVVRMMGVFVRSNGDVDRDATRRIWLDLNKKNRNNYIYIR